MILRQPFAAAEATRVQVAGGRSGSLVRPASDVVTSCPSLDELGGKQPRLLSATEDKDLHRVAFPNRVTIGASARIMQLRFHWNPR